MMKKGLLHKSLIAPLIFVLLFIGTLVPIAADALRVLLQFLPQVVIAFTSAIINLFTELNSIITHFLGFFSPGVAHFFSSLSSGFLHMLTAVFTAITQMFSFVVGLLVQLVGIVFYLLSQIWGLFSSIFIQILSFLGIFLQTILAFLVLVLQLLLYVLQTVLFTLFAFINKFLSMFPALREFSDYVLHTPFGRLVREVVSLFFNKLHRIEAKYAWHNFLKKLK